MVFLLAVTAGSAQAVEWLENGHSYELIEPDEQISWGDADAAAEAAGRYLATITSQEEQQFIEDNVLPAYAASYWLGGTDELVKGVWTWVTGETWDYTHWYAGEPNNIGGEEDYLMIFSHPGPEFGYWNDENTAVTGYILEVPEPTTLSLLALVGLAAIRRRT